MNFQSDIDMIGMISFINSQSAAILHLTSENIVDQILGDEEDED